MQASDKHDVDPAITRTKRRVLSAKDDAKQQISDLIERTRRGEFRGEALATLAAFAAVTAGAAAIGARATRKNTGLWYRLLRKPPFQPSKKAFAPVWTGLYALIAVSGFRVYRKPASRERTQALALWGTQLALNTGWSVLFFGKKAKKLALADLVALLSAIAAYTERASKVDRGAAWMMAPYMGWVSFAGLLNEELARRNR